ncbi:MULTISPECIES: hypothetical protein [Rufibacter]|uniref:Uncharacterized protein n=1 Tax=Rufibacter quisquiliarum TaxID=1549639 RepID=A0A839GMS2_9BACT|nr:MULTISPECIES: hypothetical protein [Rufibacter]MBA9076845.1 hypothetical protein [Rufibacter quisquiliarum]
MQLLNHRVKRQSQGKQQTTHCSNGNQQNKESLNRAGQQTTAKEAVDLAFQ